MPVCWSTNLIIYMTRHKTCFSQLCFWRQRANSATFPLISFSRSWNFVLSNNMANPNQEIKYTQVSYLYFYYYFFKWSIFLVGVIITDLQRNILSLNRELWLTIYIYNFPYFCYLSFYFKWDYSELNFQIELNRILPKIDDLRNLKNNNFLLNFWLTWLRNNFCSGRVFWAGFMWWEGKRSDFDNQAHS